MRALYARRNEGNNLYYFFPSPLSLGCMCCVGGRDRAEELASRGTECAAAIPMPTQIRTLAARFPSQAGVRRLLTRPRHVQLPFLICRGVFELLYFGESLPRLHCESNAVRQQSSASRILLNDCWGQRSWHYSSLHACHVLLEDGVGHVGVMGVCSISSFKYR